MRLIFISQNRSFGELLRSTLARANIQVIIANELSRVQKLFDNKVDYILVELALGELGGVDFIYKLKKMVSLTNF